jgi:hypothetical protein
MSFVTRKEINAMGLTYRFQKKEPLTIEEMDGNFANLDDRVKHLESNPPLAEGIANVTQEGDQLTLHGTFGTLLGKVILPKVFPNPKGKWQPQVTYRMLDWVQFRQGVYTCVQPHTSTDFNEDQKKWSLVFEV